MAGKKKKTKATANSNRGFATTSLPSKPRTESEPPAAPAAATPSSSQKPHQQAADDRPAAPSLSKRDLSKALSPEEYAKQLEQDDLQLLVEKHAVRSRRDVQRQKTRLETDRRILRSQAEPLSTKKWLPQELMGHILDLIQAEGRFANTSLTSDTLTSSRLPPEEDLTIKLWTLQQTLTAVNFPEERVTAAVKHVLDISANIYPAAAKDSIWGLEEALDWFARECNPDDLPAYENKGRRPLTDTPADSPLQSGATTPRLLEPPTQNLSIRNGPPTPRGRSQKKPAIPFIGDIEADDLIPEYVESKERLLRIRRSRTKGQEPDEETETARLNGKIGSIEKDPLFDKFAAEEKWKPRMAAIERELAAARKAEAEKERDKKAAQPETEAEVPSSNIENGVEDEDDEVSAEAARMAADILAEGDAMDDDDALAGLFDSLPTEEVDTKTGESQTMVSSGDGGKVHVRDFGKWSGVDPRRTLEEACKSRDSGVKIAYSRISDVSYANRHEMMITWSKAQGPLPQIEVPDIEAGVYGDKHYLKMVSVATPDSKQSEVFISTVALFLLFGNSGKDEKVSLRLPPVWRDLWDQLMELKKDQLDRMDRDAVGAIRKIVREKQDQELEDGVVLTGAFRGRTANKMHSDTSQDPSQDRSNTEVSVHLQQLWYNKMSTPKFQHMLQSRMQLPMWGFKQQVLDAVDKHQVVIICGETGCGKSTQTPSFILEHQLGLGKQCKIYCTEPRRISALSLARRVSEELGEGRNDIGTPRSLVGYAIRLESNTCKDTRLVYATTGIVMRMLEGSNDLKDVTHLVLDEVHERSIDSDFLLIVLKKLLVRRRDLKVVLMSATVDSDRFSSYLGGAPVLNVPGRTFPVRIQYLEDAVELTGYTVDKSAQVKMEDLDDDSSGSEHGGKQLGKLKGYSPRTRSTLQLLDEYQIDFDLMLQLLIKIANEASLIPFSKAILIFLPGIAEIRTMNDLILGDRNFGNWLVYPLHSTIATEEQEEAFLIPPEGKRKIVLATNIAETGITIPDVTCVIDTGKHREMRFDEKKQMSRLIDTFISRANAKQRRGRAGRVQEGLCFHMFTKLRHDNIMSDQQTPEMLRLSLQELAIRVKTCKIGGIEETLGEALDPPSAKNIRRAVDALVEVRALTSSGGELTPLGHQLARLPVDVFLGKLILFGTIFKCLDMALTVAAILSVKSPFVAPFGERAKADRARLAYSRGDSDVLTVYDAYLAWKRVAQSTGGKVFQFCQKNYLSTQSLTNIEDTKGQLLVQLADSSFLQLTEEERRNLSRLRYSGRRRNQAFFELPARVNTNSDNDVVCASVIAWSFYPKLLVRDVPGGKALRNIWNNQNISIHPSSVNKTNRDVKWLSYYHIMQSKTFYNAHETTAVDPFAIALLSGEARMDVSHFLPIRTPPASHPYTYAGSSYQQMFSGTITLDGARARFSVADWKTMLVIKVLRARLRDLLTRAFKSPGKLTMRSQQHERWLEVWQKLFSAQNGLVSEQREKQKQSREQKAR
ncbi:ATP-dependent RNA helicase A [Zalerion maritima]|uniref:RNA helicase n=1 Tax=Zalerion maritima TaxID=339359 RepID=A0AAD5RHA1_9PEZI|nr:ATP-dependent RNA helicase A [Zalerion maritima]